MVTERSRLAIVGAGTVGSTIAYAVMLRGLVHEIVLVDAVPHKAEAEAKDLTHGSMFVPSVGVIRRSPGGRPRFVRCSDHRRGQTEAGPDAPATC